MNAKGQIKKVIFFVWHRFLVYSSYKAFKNRYKKYNPDLLVNRLPDNIIQKYKKRWGCYGVKVETETFAICHNLSKNIDDSIVPEYIFASFIEAKLNPSDEISFFEVKNVYERWMNNAEVFPKTYFHKINGVFYDRDFNAISDISSFIKNSNIQFPVILKPSKDTYGGKGVVKASDCTTLIKNLNKYPYLICQECIKQHDYISRIYDQSINSIRSCVYRDLLGESHVLNTSIRFGVNGSLDNVTSGGLVCDINRDGSLNNYATDYFVNKYDAHPNSKVLFGEVTIPYYDQLISTSIEIAKQIPFANLISLDMCLDNEGKWRCLEVNLRGQTIYFKQYAGKGFFGEFTDDVIERTRPAK